MNMRLAFLGLALAASNLAWAQAPGQAERVARLSYVEGEIRFQAADGPATSTLPDRPLLAGDSLTTLRDGRAELGFGTAVLRLDNAGELSVTALDAAAVRMQLTEGSASLRLNDLLENETFEIATPNATIDFQAPGEYRVDVAADGSTEFTVRSGVAEVATAGGPVRVADGQRVLLDGRDASLAALEPADAFDDWVLERELRLAEAEPPRYTPYEGDESEPQYEELDNYGEWYEDSSYGRVWMPGYAYGGYDPFRYGHWQRVGFGWSWVEPMPWGFYTSHYGRWAYLHGLNRWCWVPSRWDHRRRFAHDGHPFGHPRNDDRNDNDDRDDRSDRDDDRPPATRGLPRRIEGDYRPAFRPTVESVKQSGGGTVVSRPAPAPRPPVRSSPAPRPQPSGGGTTMSPSRPAPAPAPAAAAKKATSTSKPATPSNNKDVGTIRPP